jgi:hypothetical protein
MSTSTAVASACAPSLSFAVVAVREECGKHVQRVRSPKRYPISRSRATA